MFTESLESIKQLREINSQKETWIEKKEKEILDLTIKI
jgi:hypothetical protein